MFHLHFKEPFLHNFQTLSLTPSYTSLHSWFLQVWKNFNIPEHSQLKPQACIPSIFIFARFHEMFLFLHCRLEHSLKLADIYLRKCLWLAEVVMSVRAVKNPCHSIIQMVKDQTKEWNKHFTYDWAMCYEAVGNTHPYTYTRTEPHTQADKHSQRNPQSLTGAGIVWILSDLFLIHGPRVFLNPQEHTTSPYAQNICTQAQNT